MKKKTKVFLSHYVHTVFVSLKYLKYIFVLHIICMIFFYGNPFLHIIQI